MFEFSINKNMKKMIREVTIGKAYTFMSKTNYQEIENQC
jgi:hypothetical protein